MTRSPCLAPKPRADLSRLGVPARIYANFIATGKQQRQVDLLVVTAGRCVQIEVKNLDLDLPLIGQANGPWRQRRIAAGQGVCSGSRIRWPEPPRGQRPARCPSPARTPPPRGARRLLPRRGGAWVLIGWGAVVAVGLGWYAAMAWMIDKGMGVYLVTIQGREVRAAHGNRRDVLTCPVCQAIRELVEAHPGIGRLEIWQGVPSRLVTSELGLHIQSLVAGGYLDRTTENLKPHVFRAAALPPDEREVDRPEPKAPKPRKRVTRGDANYLRQELLTFQQDLLTAIDEAVSPVTSGYANYLRQELLTLQQELLTAIDEAVSEAEQRIIDKIHQSSLWQRQAANAELVERIRLLEDENATLRAQL